MNNYIDKHVNLSKIYNITMLLGICIGLILICNISAKKEFYSNQYILHPGCITNSDSIVIEPSFNCLTEDRKQALEYLKTGNLKITQIRNLLRTGDPAIMLAVLSKMYMDNKTKIPKTALLDGMDKLPGSWSRRLIIDILIDMNLDNIESILKALLKKGLKEQAEIHKEDKFTLYARFGGYPINAIKEYLKDISGLKIKKPRSRQTRSPKNYNIQQLISIEPWKATRFKKLLEERYEKVNKITNELTKEYPDNFIGLIVYGSMVRPHFIPESDIDYIIVMSVDEKHKTLSDEIHRITYDKMKSNGLKPCEKIFSTRNLCNTAGLNTFKKSNISYRMIRNLFRGVFFGDRKRLIISQQKALSKIDEEYWKHLIIENLLEDDSYFSHTKHVERFNIMDKAAQCITQAAILLYTLPIAYNHTAKILFQTSQDSLQKQIKTKSVASKTTNTSV